MKVQFSTATHLMAIVLLGLLHKCMGQRMAFSVYWYELGQQSDWGGGRIDVGKLIAVNQVPSIHLKEMDGGRAERWPPDFKDLVPLEVREARHDHFAVNAFAVCSSFQSRTLNFRVLSDDGVRVLVDGKQLTDPSHWSVHSSLYEYFTVDFRSGEQYKIELQYFENSGGASLTFEVSINGDWRYVDSTLCSPGSPRSVVPFSGNRYQTFDATPFDAVETSCDKGSSDFSAILDGNFQIATETVDVRALATHYSFGAACLLVRDAESREKLVALKTHPQSLHPGDRYCNSSGITVERKNGSYKLLGERKCLFRLLAMKSGTIGSEDHAYGSKYYDQVKSIYFGGAGFASLDGSAPTDAPQDGNCLETRAYRMPDGWNIAPYDEHTQAALIGGTHTFGSSCMFTNANEFLHTQYATGCEMAAAADYTSLSGYFAVGTCSTGILIKNAAMNVSEAAISWKESWFEKPEIHVNVVQAFGKLYGSILGTAPTLSSTSACAGSAIAIPQGYSLVPPGDSTLKAVAMSARFGTNCLLTSDGSGYVPLTGKECSSEIIQQEFDGTMYYAVKTCAATLMMTTNANKSPNDMCGTCVVWGGSHFSTFDSNTFEFFGSGEYWLSVATKDSHPVDNDLNWYVRTVQDDSNAAVRLSAVVIKYHEDILRISASKENTLTPPSLSINDVNAIMPLNQAVQLAEGAIVSMTAANLHTYTVRLPNGVVVQVVARYWGQNSLDIHFTIPNRYAKSSQGLCGNCDWSTQNDFRTPDCRTEYIDPSQTDVIHGYAEKWKLTNTNKETPTSCSPPIDTSRFVEFNRTGARPDPHACANAPLARLKRAESACAILDGQLRRSCMSGVCRTGNPGIATESINVRRMTREKLTGPSAECTTTAITKHTRTMHSMTYALLDNTNPEDIVSGCQNQAFKIPYGWQIAQDTPLNLAALTCYPWGTDCVLFANGKSYTPQLKECRMGDLITEGSNGECYRPLSCNTRILLVKSPDSNSILANREFKADPNDMYSALGWQTLTYGQSSYIRSRESVFGKRGAGSIYVSTSNDKQIMGAVFTSTPLGQSGYVGRGFKIGAWAKGINVVRGAGANSADFSLYLDIYFTDGTGALGKYYAGFEGTGDWEFKEVNVLLDPSKKVRVLKVYLLFRRHIGEAYFSNVEIGLLDVEQFNLLKQGTFDDSVDEWMNLDAVEAVRYGSKGAGSHLIIDRRNDPERGTSGVQQGVLIRNGDLNQAYSHENERTFDSIFFSARSTASSFVATDTFKPQYYSIYLDVQYVNRATSYGIFEPFDPTMSEEQTIHRVFSPASKDVLLVSFNAMLRNVRGKASFDNLFLTTTCHDVSRQSPNSGITFGDPHIRSLDAEKDVRGLYDIQAVGEFILFSDKFVEVQTRQSNAAAASVNTAIHIRTPSAAIQIDVATGKNPPTLRINGSKVLLRSGDIRSFNGEVDGMGTTTKMRVSGSLELDSRQEIWTSVLTLVGPETYVHTITVTVHRVDGGEQFIQAFVDPPEQVAGTTKGLLGNFDGDPENDWKVPYQNEPVNTVEEFAEAWRVSAQQSAFVYEDKVDGTAFTDKNFKPVKLDRFPWLEQKEARAICEQIGVTGSMVESCVFDVLVGGRAYGESAYDPIVRMQAELLQLSPVKHLLNHPEK